jgi:hypothetical protein
MVIYIGVINRFAGKPAKNESVIIHLTKNPVKSIITLFKVHNANHGFQAPFGVFCHL